MNFDLERNCFYHLRDNLSNEAKTEYERGVRNLLKRYNTAIRENRFLSGGVVEIFTLALMRSTGIKVEPFGAEGVRGDLKLDTGQLLSVKSSFTGTGAIKLVNKMGSDVPPWETATLFVIAKVGIIYGDPTMIKEDDLNVKFKTKAGDKSPDSRDIKRRAIKDLAKDPLNVLPMNLPLKPKKGEAGTNRKASDDVAIQLLKELEMKILSDLVLSDLTENSPANDSTKQLSLDIP